MTHPVTDRLPEESLLAYLSRLTAEAEALPAALEAHIATAAALGRAAQCHDRLQELTALLDARTLPAPTVSVPAEETTPAPALPAPEAEAADPEPAAPSVRERVLAYLEDHPWTRSADLAAALGANRGSVSGQLSVAKSAGLLDYQDGLYALRGAVPLAVESPAPSPVQPPAPAYVSTPRILDHFSEGIELSVSEAVELIGCSARDVRDLARAGQLVSRQDPVQKDTLLYSRAPARERSA